MHKTFDMEEYIFEKVHRKRINILMFHVNVLTLQAKMLSCMKKYEFIFLMLAASVLTGCAPRVVTDILAGKYPPVSRDSVHVFLIGEELPDKTLTIGTMKVVDSGLSVKGSYERVLNMAVDATAENGGNGLVLTEHRVPDARYTIHRVWGNMLRLPQSVADTLTGHTVERVLAQTDEDYDGYMSYKMARQRVTERYEQAPHNIVRFSVGPSWLASKYELGNKVYKSKIGIDIAVDYDHVWKSGLGIGVNYLHNYTSFDEGISLHLNYIGPSFVGTLPFRKSRWDFALGVGYCQYSESVGSLSYSENHVAPLMRVGYEYKLGQNIALGLQINMISVKLDEPDDVVLEKDEFYGIQRAGIQAGLRYYF